ncbi:unnamed protein product, partial [Ectocarpus sp. 8 AP-2014]
MFSERSITPRRRPPKPKYSGFVVFFVKTTKSMRFRKSLDEMSSTSPLSLFSLGAV